MAVNLEEELVRQINEALFQSGERDRLKESVKSKLMAIGWQDKLSKEADKILAARNVDSISPPELSSLLIPIAESLIPANVKMELEKEVYDFLEKHVKIT